MILAAVFFYAINLARVYGSWVINFPGNTTVILFGKASSSPALPCMYAPTIHASSGLYFCASKAVIIPVKISPMPPLAIAGLLVGLKYNLPCGVPIIV